MSTPESRLSAAERAALADLESAAAAADPHLDARLRGRTPSRALPALSRARVVGLRGWAAILGLGWWGIPILVAGLALAVIGLSQTLALSVLGLLVAAVGLRVLVELVDRRLFRSSGPPRP
jgi:hypothetical protein